MRIRSVGAVLLTVALLTSCSARPGPAPIADDPNSNKNQTSSAEPTPEVPTDKKNRDEIVIGIDPLSNGLNPHLVADDSAFVQSLAKLVLPSAFVDGKLNTDLLIDAAEIPPTQGTQQTVRYRIRNEAQWSDGSPITATDFNYLWTNMNSEPAVINPAGYRAIKEIRSENSGKDVIVDFSDKVQNWQQLFSNLLPSHLFSIGTESFDRVLATNIPASGGRYMVRSVDRKRGVVELGRNDRFWGDNPAKVELLTFREVASMTQSIEMLRTKQIAFVDATPTETSADSLRISGGMQSRGRSRDSQLQLIFNAQVLREKHLRRGIASMLDVPMIARLAAGRSSELDASPAIERDETAVSDALESLNRPLRIAFDPADDQAVSAAGAIAGMIRSHGLTVELVPTDYVDLTEKRLPEGSVDAILSWQRLAADPISTASQLGCNADTNGKTIYSGNLSGWCDPELTAKLQGYLAGAEKIDSAQIFAQESLNVPIMMDRRTEALSEGVIGPDPQLTNWPIDPESGSIQTAPTWRKK